MLAEFTPSVFGVSDAVVYRLPEKSIVLRLQRGCDAYLVSVSVRGEREQARMLRRPAEPPDTRSLGSFHNQDFTDEASNSPAALGRLLPRDPPKRFVSDAFHEPRAEQRGCDEPVANILAVRQRLYLWYSLPHRFRRYQRTAGRGNEFVGAAEVSCSQFRYRTASSRQTPITCRRVAAEAGAFVEMDAKSTSGSLNLLERFPSRIELFLG